MSTSTTVLDPLKWEERTEIGDYKFHWDEMVTCYTGTGDHGHDHPMATVLFRIAFMDYSKEQDFFPELTEWAIVVPEGKNRVIKLDVDPAERCQLRLASNAIIEYRKLGYGGGLEW